MGIFVISRVCLYRDGLIDILRRRDGIEVVGSAALVTEAMDVLRELQRPPTIVLLDMASAESLRSAHDLLNAFPETRIVAIAVPNSEHELLACAAVGISGFVTLEASIDQLVATLESAARNEALCSPSLTAALLRRVAALTRDSESLAPMPELTTREREVARLLDEGLSNKQIAERLCIEVTTVKNHVHHILDKLGVHRRAEAAARLRMQTVVGRSD